MEDLRGAGLQWVVVKRSAEAGEVLGQREKVPRIAQSRIVVPRGRQPPGPCAGCLSATSQLLTKAMRGASFKTDNKYIK